MFAKKKSYSKIFLEKTVGEAHTQPRSTKILVGCIVNSFRNGVEIES
jgi:hypothetical protein